MSVHALTADLRPPRVQEMGTPSSSYLRYMISSSKQRRNLTHAAHADETHEPSHQTDNAEVARIADYDLGARDTKKVDILLSGTASQARHTDKTFSFGIECRAPIFPQKHENHHVAFRIRENIIT